MSLASEVNPDIIFFAENEMSIGLILESLNAKKVKYFYNQDPICEKIVMFSKFKNNFVRPIKSNLRYTVREIRVPSFPDFNIMALHYQSKRNWDFADQAAHSVELKTVIEDFEQKVNHQNTVIMGDFNMNPFDHGMVQSTGLHAIMCRSTALKDRRIVDGKEYPFFYNPMWSFYGDQGKGPVNGTYYKSISKPVNYFWNILDQVLIRPSFLNHFDEDELRIVTKFGRQVNLLNKSNKIKKSISDHLPIMLKIKQ